MLGVTTTVPVVWFIGTHEYVSAPFAINVADDPAQIVALVNDKVGNKLTSILMVCKELEQP